MPDLRERLKQHLSDCYTIERELGGGGMSRVFLATDTKLQRPVVIKVLPDEIAAGISAERFRREIQLAAKLQHPHIVPVLSASEVAGKPYFTMPFIDGESLRQRIDREGELPLDDAVKILRDVASALSHAHKQGVVHRDIKPDNVMLEDEYAVVTDFGVAKALRASTVEAGVSMTTAGVAIGTPAYMAPEQAVADPATDHRADIYSFGVVAYELLTGAPPFTGRTTQAILAAHAVETPELILKRRPRLPEWLGDMVMRCLEKRPADRPQSAAEILKTLQSAETFSTGGAPRIERPRAWSTVRGLAAAAMLAVAAALTLYMVQARGGDVADARADEIRSVAVLPLVNLSGSREDEYFSDGMSDELANALGQIPGLKVASRTSAHTFKGRKDVNVADIGKALKVQAVIEGTVRRAGERLRVSAQLTSVRDGLALWSNSYDRQAQDVFAVQEDIARSIAEALKLRLASAAGTPATAASGTASLEAYDLYLRGRYFWNARGADNLRRAISYFDQAIEADPAFARAFAARAIAWALLPQYTDASPSDALEKTRSDARRALSGDSTLAEAHTALGLAAVNNWDWDAAEKSYLRAISLDPRYPTAHQWYGELLYTTSRLDSSVAETRRARELDPLAPILTTALGYALFVSRRYDDAVTELRRGTELAPNLGVLHAMASLAYLFAGDNASARREMEIAVKADPELMLRQGHLAYVYAKTGDLAEAREIVSGMRRRAPESRHQVAFAVAYVALGEHDRALTLLEQAVRQKDINLLTAASPIDDPLYDPIRHNPRFTKIVQQMGLGPFLREGGR